jgi:23S rRNA (uracil1939-C5)-methyltransferase
MPRQRDKHGTPVRQSSKNNSQRHRRKPKAAGNTPPKYGVKNTKPVKLSAPITGTVSHMADRGDGVVAYGHDDQKRCHLPGTLPGEVVEFATILSDDDPRIADGKLLRILEPSSARQDAPCQHFGVCGGCQLQHTNAATIAGFKTERVRRALMQIGLPTDTLAPTLTAWGDDPAQSGRRRMEFAMQHHGQDIKIGLHQSGTRQLIDLAECPVADPMIAATLPDLRAFAAIALKHGEQADCHVTATDNGPDIVLTRTREPSLDERLDWPDFLAQRGWPRLSWRPSHRDATETVTAFTTPKLTIAGHKVPMPAGGFIQATRAGQDSLIETVMALVKAQGSNAYCVDLFCGLGTFTLPLLADDPMRKVRAYDLAGDALQCLRQAAVDHGSRLLVEARDLFRKPLYADELKGTDCVIFDPPRAGAEEQAKALANSKVPTIIAVSCNPVSFARDARLLIEAGYRMGRVQPIDQFQWSVETELVAAFTL